MEDKIVEVMEKYGKELAAISEEWKIIVRIDGKITEAGGFDAPIEKKILESADTDQAWIISGTPYCTEWAKRAKPLRAALDDMAQIVGCQVETVDYEEESLRAALAETEGCFVKDRCTITKGRNIYEALTALTVLEKSAEVNLKAEVLGGVVYIEESEAAWMRKNYLDNYSKEEEKIKSEEGRD